MERILIVEDNLALLHMQKDWLENAGYLVRTAIDEPSARKWLRKEAFGLVFSDVRFPEGDGISLLEWIAKEKIDVPFVIMTVKLGAKDYLPKPVYRDRLLGLAKEWLKTPVSIPKKEAPLLRRTSPAARQAEELARRVAVSDMSVLILGSNGTGKESVAQAVHRGSDMSVLILGANGTGKESVAQAVHRGSARKDKPFIAVNCGAVPKELAKSEKPFIAVNCGAVSKELAKSEFFGHMKGSFTGSVSDKKGYFEMAEGGTLFLDELGAMPYDVQVMLLRVLQEGTYMPVGATRERTSDVRVIAATNEDLQKAIAEGRFREDLYHRLAGFD